MSAVVSGGLGRQPAGWWLVVRCRQVSDMAHVSFSISVQHRHQRHDAQTDEYSEECRAHPRLQPDMLAHGVRAVLAVEW